MNIWPMFCLISSPSPYCWMAHRWPRRLTWLVRCKCPAWVRSSWETVMSSGRGFLDVWGCSYHQHHERSYTVSAARTSAASPTNKCTSSSTATIYMALSKGSEILNSLSCFRHQYSPIVLSLLLFLLVWRSSASSFLSWTTAYNRWWSSTSSSPTWLATPQVQIERSGHLWRMWQKCDAQPMGLCCIPEKQSDDVCLLHCVLQSLAVCSTSMAVWTGWTRTGGLSQSLCPSRNCWSSTLSSPLYVCTLNRLNTWIKHHMN